MKYFFILGRNPELSIAELRAIFGNFEFERKSNAIVAEIPEIKKDFIGKLGGIVSIGEILGEVENLSEIDSQSLYLGTKNSMSYVLWNFSNAEKSGQVLKYLKSRFKEEKLRAVEKRISGKMNLQSGGTVPSLSNKKLIDEQYFVFGNYFGRVVATCDYEQIEARDMEKPVRRENLAISPRLAKILINLSEVKPGETLLDCFCGIGVILEEALLQGIDVVGIDRDKDAIEGAKKNLRHFGIEKENFMLMNLDSTTAKIPKVQGIATEPDLRETLKRSLSEKTAMKALSKYEGLMIRVLNNFKLKVSGKIAFTGPCIKTWTKKRFSCNIARILDETGLKIESGFPIQEFREGQVVGREIFVLKR